jgi:hypothetical protein
MLSRVLSLVAVCAALSFGCAHEQTATSSLEVTSAPVDFTVYPHVMYEGHTTYLVHGVWYFQDERGQWLRYTEEPLELRGVRQAHPEWQ